MGIDVITLALAKKYTKESLAGAGALKGEKGDPFTYDDFTSEQLEALKVKGDKGDPFIYSDFTPEQLAALKGEKGDAFTFADFTPEELLLLKGEKGDSFTYNDFTQEQLNSLKGPAFTYDDFTQEQLNSLKGPKGDSYEITSSDYDQIAKLVSVPTNTSDLVNDSNFVTDIKLNGESVVNQNGSIDLQLGNLDTTLGETITCNQAIGGIAAGTTFTSDTTIADIIRALLKVPVIETDGAIYYGLSRDIPTSVEGLTPVTIDRDTLLSSGYTYKNINTDDQRVILAIPKSFGIVCYQISVSGFGIGFDSVETDKYIIYYDGLSTGSYRYVYSFEEA